MIQETANYTIHDFRIQTKTASHYSMNSHHFHHEYEIYYMNSGSRQYFIHDRTYGIKEGDIVLIRPHDLHKTIDTGTAHSRLLISFKKDYIIGSEVETLLSTCFGKSSVYSFDHASRLGLESMLTDMITVAGEENAFRDTKMQALFSVFLVELAGYIKTYKGQHEGSEKDDKITQILNYLKNHYADNLSLDQLAETFFISPYYMSRLFKKETGFTIFEYIQSMRIIEAQRLLVTTSRKISDISETVGFANSTSLGKVFKSITGLSPLAYRKLNRK